MFSHLRHFTDYIYKTSMHDVKVKLNPGLAGKTKPHAVSGTLMSQANWTLVQRIN
jgi:hypothetical protein